MDSDRDNFFLLGLAVAIMVTLIALAGLGVIDMDDTQTNLNPPTTQEVTP